MVTAKKLVHVRLDATLVRAIDHLAVDHGTTRASMMETLLAEMLERQRGPATAEEQRDRLARHGVMYS